MGGYDYHVAIIGDWIPLSPSPRAFFSSVISDDEVAQSSADSGSQNKIGPLFLNPGNADQIDQAQASAAVSDRADNSSALAETQMTSRGGLMERMAARAGFNAPRLNTNSIRPADLSKSPEIRSPYLTIPPGLSPHNTARFTCFPL